MQWAQVSSVMIMMKKKKKENKKQANAFNEILSQDKLKKKNKTNEYILSTFMW